MNIGPILFIAAKDLRLLLRHRSSAFTVVVFPFLMALVFGLIFSGSGGGNRGHMEIGLVDEDHTEFSARYGKKLGGLDGIHLQELAPGEARERVRKGSLTAYVRLKKGFGSAMGVFAGNQALIEINSDPSRQAEVGFLEGMVVQSVFMTIQGYVSDRGFLKGKLKEGREALAHSPGLTLPERAVVGRLYDDLDRFLDQATTGTLQEGPGGSSFLKIDKNQVTVEGQKGPKTSFEVTFPSGCLWGVMACAASFAFSIVTERTRGTFLRLRLSPLTRLDILLGKGLACFIASVSITCLLMAVGHVVFKVPIANPLGFAMAVASTSFCYVGIMMLVAVLARTEQAVGGFSAMVNLIFAMFGGGMIPLVFMPEWMLRVSTFSPVKWGIYSLEGAIWRGLTVSEMVMPCGILLAIGGGCFLVGERLFERTD